VFESYELVDNLNTIRNWITIMIDAAPDKDRTDRAAGYMRRQRIM